MVIGILAGAIASGPTLMSIGSKGIKHALKGSNIRKSFLSASAFGAGYGAFTNIGYNLSNSYITPGLRSQNTFKQTSPTQYMYSYGGYRSNRYSRYSRPRYRPRTYRYRRPAYRSRRYY